LFSAFLILRVFDIRGRFSGTLAATGSERAAVCLRVLKVMERQNKKTDQIRDGGEKVNEYKGEKRRMEE
jgi:hypothetical protein